MKNLIFEFENKIQEEINKQMDEVINSMFKSTFMAEGTEVATYTNSTFTKEKLDNLYKQIEPYMNVKKDLYLNTMPTLKLKVDEEKYEDDFYKHRFLYSYGMPLLKPTKTIITKVQRRKHKQKRINKKWLKKYGYIEIKKEVPDYGIISISTC